MEHDRRPTLHKQWKKHGGKLAGKLRHSEGEAADTSTLNLQATALQRAY